MNDVRLIIARICRIGNLRKLENVGEDGLRKIGQVEVEPARFGGLDERVENYRRLRDRAHDRRGRVLHVAELDDKPVVIVLQLIL